MSTVSLGHPMGFSRGGEEEASHEGFRALVDAVVAKAPGADRILVDRFKGHVHRLLRRMLGPGPDVEDLLQEALFRVFQRLHKVDPPEALPGFVTAITVHVAREALRKRRRGRWLSFFSTDDLAGLSSRSGTADIPDDVRAFYDVVGRMPEQSQVLVTLRYVEGMSLAELADVMGVSLATVKRHLGRAEDEFVGIVGKDDRHLAPWSRRGAQ